MHEDHRKRLKNRFLTEGLDHFDPHNILELLLFYSIPQQDTNETAHRLLDHFGSLEAVFDASFEELIQVPGIKEHSATLIKMVPALARVYAVESEKRDVVFQNHKEIGEYLTRRYIGIGNETVFMMLLDNKHGLIDFVKVYEGSVNSSAVTVRRLIEIAILRHASMVILSHNHPSGNVIPSSDDLNTTFAMRRAFATAEIPLLGHYIVAGNQYYNIFDALPR